MTSDDNFPPDCSLRVDVARQALHLLSNGVVVKSWPVSTSKFGLGSEPGSFKTPVGRFRISEKIGAAAPAWSVFKSRLPTGEISAPGGEQDGVLTRILWLEGLEESNRNTRDRYIYIHGTNQEHLIGQPASHGCIRLRNEDVMELFSMVPDGAGVEIA
ncbi:MAG: L,D-transpeptidase [Terrimicrobiaceae bacterium]|nr:L,D-transpeptidase [Terrimicrobiaceae bacterium]